MQIRPNSGPNESSSPDAQTPHPLNSGSVFDYVGEQFFDTLCQNFYNNVALIEQLASIYPDPVDFTHATLRLKMFLVQYFGGPTTYSNERGHPRLRMRHASFVIDQSQHDNWMSAMTRAVDLTLVGKFENDHTLRTVLMDYFVMAAAAMQNA